MAMVTGRGFFVVTMAAVMVAACGPLQSAPRRPRPEEWQTTRALNGDSLHELPEVVPNSCRPPAYPVELRQNGTEGRVILAFVIDSAGQPERESVTVVNATNEGFVFPSIGAVLSCRFSPARINGRPVAARVSRMPINFTVGR